MIEIIKRLQSIEKRLARMPELGSQPVWLQAPLTSTAWDGDAYSTTAKTKIDLSAVFSAPAGIKAVLVNVSVRDSGSDANPCFIILSPTNTADVGIRHRCSGVANDKYTSGTLLVPCDANGDIYFQVVASGASTFDVIIEIFGYWK